jgi:hypothetical protein
MVPTLALRFAASSLDQAGLEMTTPAYCTILARNYLPRALTLSGSLHEHGSELPLTVFLTDATAETQLPELPGVRWMRPASLGLPERTVLELAMSYDLVEFATAVKPLVLQSLLREHEQVVYLDPDTYQVSPMVELGPALQASSGIVLTPHFLEPTRPDGAFTEGHLLGVGVYNLGFCAVDRRAGAFLDWWWRHLRSDCLHDPLAGLFVDQKWVDIGSVLFGAAALRHPGYNVGAANLHQRPVAADAEGYYISSTGDRLRLFHFHAFDPRRPDTLSARFSTGKEGVGTDGDALRELASRYATAVIEKQRQLGPQPSYIYATDTTGRPISRHMRHAYRAAALSGSRDLPSPFVPGEAVAYGRWRRRARGLAARLVASDLAKGARVALPDEYDAIKRRFPRLAKSLRGRFVESTGMWG